MNRQELRLWEETTKFRSRRPLSFRGVAVSWPMHIMFSEKQIERLADADALEAVLAKIAEAACAEADRIYKLMRR